MSYDHWKTTNPADEWLGPDPAEEDNEEPTDRLERKLTHLRWTMVVAEVVYLVALSLIVRHFLK